MYGVRARLCVYTCAGLGRGVGCACMSNEPPLQTTAPTPPHHVDPTRRKTSTLSDPERKTNTFLLDSSVLGSSVRPSDFFWLIIISSRLVDKAPTQTLRGTAHWPRRDAAAPQIVQSSVQDPEAHNSERLGGGKPAAPSWVPTEGRPDEDPRRQRERHPVILPGHLNLQLLPAAAGGPTARQTIYTLPLPPTPLLLLLPRLPTDCSHRMSHTQPPFRLSVHFGVYVRRLQWKSLCFPLGPEGKLPAKDVIAAQGK